MTDFKVELPRKIPADARAELVRALEARLDKIDAAIVGKVVNGLNGP